MTTTQKVFWLLCTCAGIVVIPYLGAWVCFEGHFHDLYFQYPPLVAPSKAGFSWPIFISIAVMFAGLILLYIAPSVFGFRKANVVADRAVTATSFPVWFWAGLVMWGGTLLVLWCKFTEPRWLILWADLPLFWGFALLMDGWVYVRTGGKSIIGNSLQEFLGIGAASISGWLIFEYLNFFVDDNWIYPMGGMIPDNQFTIYAVVGSAGLMPLAFEWYTLFISFPKLRERFSHGPRIILGRWVVNALLVFGFVALFIIPFFPDLLFGLLWVIPLIILSVVLQKLKIWSPFDLIGKGDWSSVLLFALAYLVQGFLLEFWNYFSAYHVDGKIISQSPAYWSYSVPFVNDFHVFEMPVVGFAGYLPFGVYCIIWWIVCAYLLNVPTRFGDAEHLKS